MTRILFSLILIFTLGCSQTPKTVEPEQLRVGMRSAPDSFNPFLSTTFSGKIVASRLFPRLFHEELELRDGVPGQTPYLVSTFSWDASNRVLSLVLKDNLVWSDGVALTSADVAYSLSLRENPQVAWINSGIQPAILDWQTPSEKEILIRFERPSPFNLLNVNENFIVPAHHFSKVPLEQWREKDWAEGLVVFGPYRPGIYEAGERLFLRGMDEKTPDLGIAFIRERETLYQLLLDGELDFAWGLPVERITDIRSNLVPVIYSNLNYNFIGWNNLDPKKIEGPIESRSDLERLHKQAPHPIFSDIRVRRALTMGMNRARYLHQFWDDRAQIPVSPWAAGLPYYQSVTRPRDFDPAAAALLLDEAGWQLEGKIRHKGDQELRFTVICNAGSTMREQYLLAIQSDLANIGVAMEIELQEASKYVDALETRKFDAWFGVFLTGNNPDLSQIYHSEAALSGGYNYTSWTSVDALLEEVRNASDVASLPDKLLQMEQVFYQEQPLTLLYSGIEIGATRINGPHVLSNYLDPLFRVETWEQGSSAH